MSSDVNTQLLSQAIINTNLLVRIQELLIRQELCSLRLDDRYSNPKSLIPYGRKVYSQSDEDGIIREIFNRIGDGNRTFLEFGIGDGLENNTLALLFEGWTGMWIEASQSYVEVIRANLKKTFQSGRLRILESFITKENINQLIGENPKEPETDLLSVDLDGNDYHVLSAITCIKPRVVVIEYNAKFPPPI